MSHIGRAPVEYNRQYPEITDSIDPSQAREEYNRRTAGTWIGISVTGAAIIAGGFWGSGDIFNDSLESPEPKPGVEETTYYSPVTPETGQSATSIPDFSAADQSIVVSKY